MATSQSAPRANYSTARLLRRLPTIRSGLLFASTCGAIVGLLLIVAGDSNTGLSLAAKREILFAGLLVVQLAVIYQFKMYRQRRR